MERDVDELQTLQAALEDTDGPSHAVVTLSEMTGSTAVLYDEMWDRSRVHYGDDVTGGNLRVPPSAEPDLEDDESEWDEDSLNAFYEKQHDEWSNFLRLLSRMEANGSTTFWVRHEDGTLSQKDSVEDFYFYVDEDHQ